jgi:hypothetical protein
MRGHGVLRPLVCSLPGAYTHPYNTWSDRLQSRTHFHNAHRTSAYVQYITPRTECKSLWSIFSKFQTAICTNTLLPLVNLTVGVTKCAISSINQTTSRYNTTPFYRMVPVVSSCCIVRTTHNTTLLVLDYCCVVSIPSFCHDSWRDQHEDQHQSYICKCNSL